MGELSFDLDWVEPEGARGPELRATWARLAVRAGGKAVTRVFDIRTRSVRESIYLPLYPVAEWIVTNWWRLLYEVPSSPGFERNGFASRHNLAGAGEGFAVPALTLEPLGEKMRLVWVDRKLTWAPLEFLGGDPVFVDREDVRGALQEFVETVVGRLDDEGIEATLLQEEWQAIRDIAADEVTFCQHAAALGLDPFQIGDDDAERLLQAATHLPEPLHVEFFAAADSATLLEEAQAVEQAVEALTAPHPEFEKLRDLRTAFTLPRPAGGLPWRHGYAAAQALRRHLGLDGARLASFEVLGEALGLDEGALATGIRRVSGLGTVDGVVSSDREQRPGFVVRTSVEEARRFAFCRQLFEYLTAAATPLVVTRGATYRQQENRAFAAEFLLPSQALRSRVSEGAITHEEVDAVAEEFGVSWAVVSHQLENHRIAQVITT